MSPVVGMLLLFHCGVLGFASMVLSRLCPVARRRWMVTVCYGLLVALANNCHWRKIIHSDQWAVKAYLHLSRQQRHIDWSITPLFTQTRREHNSKELKELWRKKFFLQRTHLDGWTCWPGPKKKTLYLWLLVFYVCSYINFTTVQVSCRKSSKSPKSAQNVIYFTTGFVNCVYVFTIVKDTGH